MKKLTLALPLSLILAMTMLTGCKGGSDPDPTPALNADNVNLVFVVSPDLTYQGRGDINPDTANLTDQGLQRSLLIATYLKERVLGGNNVSAITALEPMTHLQTAAGYPDMAAIEYIEQFALLNRIELPGMGPDTPPVAGNSYPINASYADGATLPSGVVTPTVPSLGCQGLAFDDTQGDNLALVSDIISVGAPGFYVFSAPWETISALLSDIAASAGYALDLPKTYMGPDYIYAISFTLSGTASLVTYDSDLNPSATYPELPAPVPAAASPAQEPFSITRGGGQDGNTIPAEINTNETVYLIRHAEAHPTQGWDDGNYVAAGQWRALALPSFLRDKINPTMVYSIDPAQAIPHSQFIPGANNLSYVRTSLTVEPYAIANNLPLHLVSSFELGSEDSAQRTSDYFFTGGRFSGQTLLVAWEHDRIIETVNALLASYQGSGQTAPSWPSDDYDTIWTVTLDDQGTLKIDNALSEGIDSASLPAAAPQF